MNNNSPIIHISLQSFFASVEQAAHKQLARRPVAITDAKRQKIVSVSAQAKRYGVTKGMTLAAAMKQAPGITYLVGAISLYQNYSERFFKLIYSYTDHVEPLTLDQAYLVFPGASWRSAQLTLASLLDNISKELDIPVRAGMATTKITAYLASKNGTNTINVIKPGRERLFLNTLPLHALPSIGSRTTSALARFGIFSVRQLALAPQALLVSEFGEAGLRLQQQARGYDDRAVVPFFSQETLSRSSDAATPTHDIFEISQRADQALYRLEQACQTTAQQFKQLTVVVVTPQGQHSQTIAFSTYQATSSQVRSRIIRALTQLIYREPVSQIRLQAAELKTNSGTTTFFNETLASLSNIRQSLHFIYHQFGWRAPAL